MTDDSIDLIKKGALSELQAAHDETLQKANVLGQKVKTLQEQGSLGSELLNVFLEPATETNPYGTLRNPYTSFQSPGYQVKPTFLNFKTLRRIARKVEPVSAIIKLRCNQVGSFSRVSHDINQPGFRIMLENPDDSPNSKQKKEMKLIEDMLLNTGFSFNPDRPDNFESFQRKIVKDRLVLDAIAVQLIPDKTGKLVEFMPMDAGTIAFATEQYTQVRETYQPVRYVQQIDGQIVGEFTGLELAYGVANPSTDIDSHGYGESELELLIETVTAYLYSRDYNKFFFTKNSIPAGILSLNGKYKEQELTMFRRQWAAQVQGVNNAWKVPLIAAEDGKGADFKSFKTSQRDAEFMKWMDFLIKITSAVYQTSPEEINFAMGSAGSDNPMIAKEGGQAILASKDRGLVPLLRFLENFYTKNIIKRINPNYKFVFTGIEPEDENQLAELRTKRKFYLTVNEIRKEEDLKALTLDVDNPFDLPDNSVILNIWQNNKQMEQQQAMMAQGGQPGMEGAAPGAGGIPPEGGASAEGGGLEEDLEAPEEV